MGINNRVKYVNTEFDFAKATNEDVHFAFYYALPFRLRVGTLYHSRFRYQLRDYDIWIKNTQVEGDTLEIYSMPTELIEKIWSKVLVIPRNIEIKSNDVDKLKECRGDVESLTFEMHNEEPFRALQALNAFIVGYHTATGELFGGYPLHTLSILDYVNLYKLTLTILGTPIDAWNDDSIQKLFGIADGPTQVSDQLRGELTDLPTKQLQIIEESICLLDKFYFYELAFESKSKIASTDYVGGLLLAVAALEGVHGAFLFEALKNILPEERTGEDKNLEEKFLMELGFSLCNRMTPYLFMLEEERPSSELIQKVAKAVTYRNQIMHVLRNNSSGEYKIRARKNKELSDACSDTFEMYNIYRKALEKKLREENQLQE